MKVEVGVGEEALRRTASTFASESALLLLIASQIGILKSLAPLLPFPESSFFGTGQLAAVLDSNHVKKTAGDKEQNGTK